MLLERCVPPRPENRRSIIEHAIASREFKRATDHRGRFIAPVLSVAAGTRSGKQGFAERTAE